MPPPAGDRKIRRKSARSREREKVEELEIVAKIYTSKAVFRSISI